MSSLLFIGMDMTGPNMGQCIYVASVALHKAKTVLGLFCLQLNTIGWSAHETSRICKETVDWGPRVYA